MKNPGPFAQAFAIAAVFFALELAIVFSHHSGGNSSYEAGHITGQIMAHHIVAALATGAISKFVLKKAQWLTTLAIYIPACVIFIGLGILGRSQ